MSPRTFITKLRNSVLVKESAASFILKLFGAGLAMLSSVLFARHLGLEAFGQYSVIMAATALLTVLANLGFAPLSIRLISTYKTQKNWPRLKGFILFSYRWSLMAALALTVGYATWSYFFTNGTTAQAYLIAAPLILLAAFNQRRASILRGLNHVVLANLPEQVLRPLTILLLLALIPLSTKVDLDTAVAIQLAGASASLLIGGYLLARRIPSEIRDIPSENDVKTWMKEMWPFFLIAIIQAVGTHFMALYVAGLSSATEAGLFNVSLRIVELVVFGLTAITMTIQPKLASALSVGNIGKAQHLAKQSARIATLAALVVCPILLIGGHWILAMFGHEFDAAYPTLAILVIGQMVNAMTGPCGVVVSMSGRQKLSFYTLFGTSVLSLIIGFALIPGLGAEGGAWARTIMQIISNVIMVWIAWRQVGIYTLPIGHSRFSDSTK